MQLGENAISLFGIQGIPEQKNVNTIVKKELYPYLISYKNLREYSSTNQVLKLGNPSRIRKREVNSNGRKTPDHGPK
jgi:hypothetical protein